MLIELFVVYVHLIMMILTLLVVVIIFNISLITCINSIEMHGMQPTDNGPAPLFSF